MNLPLWLAKRLRTGGTAPGRAANIIALAGVALSVAVMEISLCVAVGFKDGIRHKLSGFEAQITVEAPVNPELDDIEQYLTMTTELGNIASSVLPPGYDMAMAMRMPGLLKTDGNFVGTVFAARAPTESFDFEKNNVTAGDWPDFASDSCINDIVVGERIAAALGLGVGDKVYSTFIAGGNIKLRRHRIAALYNSGFGEYDDNIVYASLAGLQRIAGIDSLTGTKLEIRGVAEDCIVPVADRLQQELIAAVATGRLDRYYPVQNVTRTGALYYNWLDLLDTNVVVILCLMFAVAAFTLVSSLFILVLENVRTIGILRSIGATKRLVASIFSFVGVRILATGTLIGNVVGLGLLVLQYHTHLLPLNPDMYYLAYVPVSFVPMALVAMNVVVLLAGWTVLAIPSRFAASTDPVRAISDL